MIPRVTLAALLLWAPVIPVWLFLTVMLGSSALGVIGFFLTPLVLLGIAATLHYLLRGLSNAWAIAALAAPILVFGILIAVAWFASDTPAPP